MIQLQGFAGKTVGVYGLARSGLSAARALKFGGARVFAWDDSETSRLEALKEGIQSESAERWPWNDITSLQDANHCSSMPKPRFFGSGSIPIPSSDKVTTTKNMQSWVHGVMVVAKVSRKPSPIAHLPSAWSRH